MLKLHLFSIRQHFPRYSRTKPCITVLDSICENWTIREFRTLFVTHTDSIRENHLHNKDGRVRNRVEKRRQNCISTVLGLGWNMYMYIIKPRIFTDSSLSALFFAQLKMDLNFAVNKGLFVFYFVGCMFSLCCVQRIMSSYFQSY